MFSHVNYNKLKTNLKLTIQRLKLLETKKTENAKKSSKEIADYISMNKYDRARIKVEHIIREDYTVEGMELVEMYNDLLLARFGLLESMKSIDPGLEESVSSIIWVAPRLEAECPELKVVAEELTKKFGKEYAQECKSGRMKTICPRVMQKFSEQPPAKLLVEKYLYEIAQSHKVPFKPDSDLALQDPEFFYNFDHSAPPYHQQPQQASAAIGSTTNNNNNDNNGGGGSAMPQLPIYPSPQISHIGFNAPAANYPVKPVQKQKQEPDNNNEELNLPEVPQGGDSYDDLTKRFENLKKK